MESRKRDQSFIDNDNISAYNQTAEKGGFDGLPEGTYVHYQHGRLVLITPPSEDHQSATQRLWAVTGDGNIASMRIPIEKVTIR